MAKFGPLSRGQPHSPDVNHCVLHFRPEGHREPHSEVGFLSQAECLVGFEPGTFRFLIQHLKPLRSRIIFQKRTNQKKVGSCKKEQVK